MDCEKQRTGDISPTWLHSRAAGADDPVVMATGDGTNTPARSAALLRPLPALETDPKRLKSLIAAREPLEVTSSQILEVIDVK